MGKIEERWKIIKGYEGYRVSSFGNIESRKKMGSATKNGYNNKWKKIKPNLSKHGYYQVNLCDNNCNHKTFKIHRIVAENFLFHKKKNYNVVRHLDGNKTNNFYKNLAWGTYIDNENDKKNHGTWWVSHMNFNKLKIEDVINIRLKWEAKELSQKELAIKFSVSRPTITRIINRKIWRQI